MDFMIGRKEILKNSFRRIKNITVKTGRKLMNIFQRKKSLKSNNIVEYFTKEENMN